VCQLTGGVMLLPVSLTVEFISLLVLVAAGWLIDRLYGGQALKDDRMLNS
jgi:F0F1-type ATP synthase assembly protein I